MLTLPTLNMGVNGDVISQRVYCADEIGKLGGVNIVLFLMGTNDILSGGIKSLDRYQQCAQTVVKQLHERGIKVYWGTIPPFKGCKPACLPNTQTPDPDKEALRVAINAWIRSSSGADGVVDFDKALADPTDPHQITPVLQSDWLHPNDAGYQAMATTAAAVLRPDRDRAAAAMPR
jgi:lysophospholipase L1-like esterase